MDLADDVVPYLVQFQNASMAVGGTGLGRVRSRAAAKGIA